ncbi:EAL domain-containing protein [Edwardsiella anguillarum]|uniref:EAL domain-containing protein n=1 Tax=Edwardsiella anguillarum TaxID=1821960 RepID=UPI0024B7ED0C|nr:EAL domain-containing protein [Edwardsiella anguillarum]WHP81290.1 EAL domain-containing protein [Edwardsiella anguillarum]WHQ18791.1 EAL domain-containing protein [Edwardsiella anguillarum]WHQ22333.1 EAL domain-containing protein [Edwardsiella anguillarum]WHQ25855.1 EAL domain-containing protein [Edwardsiella anguillarum]WHQ29378.1 EAL domain-containing protein [Edwardsiella anguillarum]
MKKQQSGVFQSGAEAMINNNVLLAISCGKKNCFAALIGGLVLTVSLAAVAWWSAESLREDTITRIGFAQRHIDTIISNAGRVADIAKNLAGRTYTESTYSLLRNSVICTPNVRAIDLVRQGHIYSTSLRVATDKPDRGSQLFAWDSLQLLPGSTATPYFPVLEYRTVWPQGILLIGIDGDFIAETLFMIHTLPLVYFQVGDVLISKSGQTLMSTQLPAGKREVVASPEWPYRLIAITPARTLFSNIVDNYLGSILDCLLLAVAASLLCYRMLTRPLTSTEKLKNALAHYEFVPYIQPVIDITTQRVKGGEILMRWIHPEVGIIPPDQFIPHAEASGLIVPMTRQLFADTSRFFRTHAARLPAGFHLGFNISQAQLLDQHIMEDCQNIMAALLPCRAELVLELLERDTTECTDEMRSMFIKLKQAGIKFALDDFGTGYSTHAYLLNFSVDYIKIDKIFIQMAGVDNISRYIVDNIIALAESLNVSIIAEGVETASQEEYLHGRNVKYLQGYRYGHPVSLDEFVNNHLASAD